MANATHDSDVLNINVLRDIPPIGRQGFGLPMIVGAASMPERVRFYSSPDAAQADATAGDISAALAAYVSKAFEQTLKPARVMVGRREPNVAQVVTFQVTGAADGDYVITINGTAYTHSATGSSAGAIASALQVLVDANPDVAASVATDTVTVTASVAGVPFTYASDGPSAITETETVANVSIATELTALKAANADWYGFALESRTDLDNEQAFAWADANDRFAGLETNTAAVKAGTAGHLGLVLKDLSRKQGFLVYRADSASKLAWAWLCNRSAINLDRATSIWSYVTIVGEAVDTLTDTEKANLQAANVNYYLTFKGIPCTRKGVNPAGEKLDTVTTSDWTAARVGERLAQVVLNTVNRGSKIPYDDTGFKLLEAEVRDVLKLGERAGHFQAGSTNAKFTLFADLTDADKDNRRAPFVFGGLLAGGVEEFEGTGYATTDEAFLDALFDTGA